MKKINGFNIKKDLSGEIYGRLTAIKPVEIRGRRITIWLCKCECGNTTKVSVDNLGKHVNSCGCLSKKGNNYTHGLSNHFLHNTWSSIKGRCFNENNNAYSRYGGRGITVYPGWVDNFISFYNYVSNLPDYGKNGYSIDRVNPYGNYEPNNLRWTNNFVQNRNTRLSKKNKTGYTGIFFDIKRKKYVSSIRNIKKVTIGWYKEKEDAVNSRNKYIIDNNLKGYNLQFYESDTEYL